MSDQNCDTSRPTTNKNPLLSASVTGLTFDDFTNKAIILPAAALPPKLPEPKEPEPTKPAIFGTEPAILDTESFSEISLDQPSDQETYPLQEDQFSTDYSKPFNPLTQATQLTASLSQLPSVASSVFSSFSNILRGSSPTPNTSTEQQHIDTYNAPPVQTLSNVPFVDSSLAYTSDEAAVPAAIPTFYSPSDPAFPPPAPTLSPPPANTASGNAYRLTSKRKTYAPAPGLTYQDNQPVSSAFPSFAPPLPNPINPIYEPNFPANQTTTYENTAVNQPPSQNNKFSLTSFFSTPLLEKITGSSAVGHSQETQAANVPDVYAIPSITPPVPVSSINPGLFDAHPPVFGAHPPATENIPTYSPHPQTYQPAPPISTPFLHPAQQTSLPAVSQTPLSACGTPEPVSNISSIPPSAAPPSGSVSSYRLRGKPHYKNPSSLTTTTAPLATPFFQATPNPTIPSEIFNPVNTSAAEVPDQSSKSSGFSQPPPPNVAFFNQPQSVPVEPKAPNVAFYNQAQSAPVEPTASSVAFFNQPQSVPVEPKASSVAFFNQPQSVPVETTVSSVAFFNQPQSVPVEPAASSVAFFSQPQSVPVEPKAPNVAFFNQPQSAPLEPSAPSAPNVAFLNQPQSAPLEPSAPNVAFFNQPQSVPVEPAASSVAFFNQPQSVSVAPNQFNQFYPNSSGNTYSFDSFGTGNVQQPPILSQTQGINTQHQQQFQLPTEQQEHQSQPVQQHQPFLVQPFQQSPNQLLLEQQQQTVETLPQQDTKQEIHPPSIPHPAFPLDQAQLATGIQTPQANLFQKFEPTKESDQLFAKQYQVTPEQPEIEQQIVTPLPPQSIFNPFAVPTSQSQSSDQQSNFSSELFTPFQTQNQTTNFYPPQTASTGSVESNQYSPEEVASENIFQPKFEEEILDNTRAEFDNLNLQPQEIAGEPAFLDSVPLQQDDNKVETLIQQSDTASTDSKLSSNFDNFFGSQTTQQSANRTVPEPCHSEPAATTNLASSFFTSPTNPSPADWFNSAKSVAEPLTNRLEDDINRNPQPPTETPDPSSFFTANNNINNQISSPPNYFQIQNFFNNPPLIADSKEQDSNFNFIENNLINKRLHNLTHHKGSIETDGGSISSNIVEPPSSAQSEFSEFAEVNPETSQSDEYIGEQQFPVDSPNIATMANTSDQQSNGGPTATEVTNVVYRPVYKHWFYIKKSSDQKPTWTPFPMNDSLNLEEALTSASNQCITTNGGRYDVNIQERTRTPVYWNGTSDEVRRCSWFYKGADSRLVPYEENVADLLEEEYRLTSQSGEWNRKIVIPSGEIVMFQAPSIMVHFLAAQTPDLWPNASVPPTANRPRVVKRGVDEFNIEDGEPEQINHLLFMVHGIGAGCDLKFRAVEEVVEDFRSIALQLTQSHYRSSCDRGEVGRIEVLPVSWHSELHSEESGIDEKLKAITLESIPKLRTFTNDTLLDILFYSSPVFCQKIMDTVAGTINRMYTKYCERNPNFKGNVSLAGHSLGSLILFDLLQNQRDVQCFDNQMDVDRSTAAECSDDGTAGVRPHKPLSRTKSKKINYTIGPAGTGQPFINYPQLVFHPKKFFALGSPIGMFVTVRGIDNLGLDYKLPTTDGFYNIFHPYDPVAYRIEALVNSDLIPVRPVLIPHHKGRKRMHLELRETMARVGADIKQKIVDTFKSVYNFASLQKNDPKSLQQEVDKVLEQQLSMETSQVQRTRACSTSTTSSDDNGDTEFSLGMLNEGKRVDYVLQEAPLEFFNEYLFALTSHVCYWDSADTILFIVKEIYTSLGMQTDNQIPQQSMTIERPISTPSTSPAPADS